jgi:ATP-dependent metalloprotease
VGYRANAYIDLQAAVYAARNSKPFVSLKDLEWAKDRVMMGAERKSAVITPEDKRL